MCIRDRAAVEQATSGWMEVNSNLVKYNGGSEVKIPELSMDEMCIRDRDCTVQQLQKIERDSVTKADLKETTDELKKDINKIREDLSLIHI